MRGGRVWGARLASGDELEADAVVLAIGHSARDTYVALAEAGLAMEAKAFAMGLRVEHPQQLIDEIQLGPVGRRLGPSTYRLAARAGDRGVYTFCMCPGGQIVCASVLPEELCVNGASKSARDGRYANSGIVVTVGPRDFAPFSQAHGALAGMAFQRHWEAEAAKLGGGGLNAPAQDLMDFLEGGSGRLSGTTTYRPGVRSSDLSLALPAEVAEGLRTGIREFGRKIRDFVSNEACLVGVETRTSAPVRLLRGESMESLSHPGLYPVGEGAGQSGGIVSSALDGVRAAQALLERWR